MSKSFTSTSSKTSMTNNNKYVPPSQRNSGNNNMPLPPPLNKSQMKAEEFNLNEKIGVFPTLGETFKPSSNTAAAAGIATNKMNFASVAKYVDKTVKEEKVVEVQPGWVHIRKHNGKIEYKYGAQKHDPFSEWYFQQEDEFIDKNFIKSIIARLQIAQDYENESLGDLSAYYDFPNIQEKLEADVPRGYHRRPKRPTYLNSNNSDSELSYVSDDNHHKN